MKTNTLENQMNRLASRSRGILALLTASLIFATAGLAQMPPSSWKKGAPFPEPDEVRIQISVEAIREDR